MNKLTKTFLAGLVYFVVSSGAVEFFAERVGLGFWTWFFVLSVFGVLIFSLVCERAFSFQPMETMVAAMLAVSALCSVCAERGWFLFSTSTST